MYSLFSEDIPHLGDWFEILIIWLSLILTTTFDVIFNWEDIITLSWFQRLFSLFSGIFVFFFLHFVFKVTEKIEKQRRKRKEEEWKIINKERNFVNLIDSMGLLEKMRKEQQKVFQNNKAQFLSKTLINCLEYAPCIYVQRFFQILFFALARSRDFCATSSHVLMDIFSRGDNFLSSLQEYKEHKISRSRVEKFLSLPEWDNQLKGISIKDSLKSIRLEKVCFRYRNQLKLIIRNYDGCFLNHQVNYLSGKNGTGKSTLIYLLLGVLKPLSGKISLELTNGLFYDLSEVNLKYWREKSVAYVSHQTLLEEGSTGEKQLRNIQNIIREKKEALLWILDEADNALDKNNKQIVLDLVKGLVSQNRMVIWVKHPDINSN